MVFMERLEALLKERRLTWKEVSTQCHIGRNQKKYWQDNEIIPGTETLFEVGRLLWCFNGLSAGNRYPQGRSPKHSGQSNYYPLCKGSATYLQVSQTG